MVHIRLLLLAVTFLAALAWGCKEKDVSFTTDQDQIKRLLTESEAGQDLFRWDSLIVPTNYTMPHGPGGIYRDSVIRHKRNIDVTISPFRVNYWYPRGMQTEAIARVIDEYEVQVTRTNGDTIQVDTLDRDLARWAFLLQLGGEAEPYKGWYLWGFKGGGSTQMSVYVTPSTGTGFPGDSSLYSRVAAANSDYSEDSLSTFGGATYIRLEDIRTIPDGSKLEVATTSLNTSGTKRPMPRITAAGPGGFFTRTMQEIDRNHYVDTIQTPTNNPRIWNIVFLETRHDTELFFTGAHVFAFRVPVE